MRDMNHVAATIGSKLDLLDEAITQSVLFLSWEEDYYASAPHPHIAFPN